MLATFEFTIFTNPKLIWIDRHRDKIIYYSIIVIAFLFRLIAALKATGILHPDEIFQSLEISHLIVYGSAIVPPEFRLENTSIPSYASSRSYLFPWVFAIIMYICEGLGINYYNGTLIIIHVFLAINSTLLIPIIKKFTYELTDDEIASNLSMIFVAFWFRIIEFTVRPFNNTFFLPYLFLAITHVLHAMKTGELKWKDTIIIFFGLGISTYVRLDLLITVFSIFIVTFHFRYIKIYFKIIIISFSGWLFGAIIDMQYYDSFFIVPYHWFLFNVVEHHSDLFGLSPSNYYYIELIKKDGLNIFVIITLISFIAFIFIVPENNVLSKIPLEYGFIRLLYANVIAWVIYANPWRIEGSHKELRFMISVLVFTLILFATSSVYLIRLIQGLELSKSQIKIHSVRSGKRKLISLIFIFFVFIISTSYGFTNRYHEETFDDITAAMEYVGQQDIRNGVVVVTPWFFSGGYTYLHRNSSIKLIFYDLTTERANTIDWPGLKFMIQIGYYNYIILPKYQSARYPEVYSILDSYGWSIDRIIDGRTEVWVHN